MDHSMPCRRMNCAKLWQRMKAKKDARQPMRDFVVSVHLFARMDWWTSSSYGIKISQEDGMSKKKLFEIMSSFEKGTRPVMEASREELKKRHGEKALAPWNVGFNLASNVRQKMGPYFPFAKAPEQYIRSYSKLNIKYEGTTMNLDLLKREKKYSMSGFCHYPKVAWKKSDGSWQPLEVNYTSSADPKAIGSGLTALTTLIHEAGHAAHFANIKQPSPLFSRNKAPLSHALTEGQAMFLDAIAKEAAWKAKYALDVDGKPIPFELIEEEIRSTYSFAVRRARVIISQMFFEKALYELPDEEVTAERIQQLADEIEERIEGGPSSHSPLLCMPRLSSEVPTMFYTAYVLGEMGVYQMREFFMKRDGYIVDNPNVGPTLAEAFWKYGNTRPFIDLIKDLTGKELSGEAWVVVMSQSVEDHVANERKEYDKSIASVAAESTSAPEEPDLNMVVRFVDGDEIISDSSVAEGGVLGACKQFEKFVEARVQG